MARRALMSLLAAVVLLSAGCGGEPGLQALRSETVADLRAVDPLLQQSLSEVRRTERAGGEALGKPVYPAVGVVYAAVGDTEELLDVVAEVLEQQGWTPRPDAETTDGRLLRATRELPEGRAEVSVYATQDDRFDDDQGSALVQSLELRP
ncbi:hypothetical protein [Aquipuribacter sp. MA13-6]|uniref:hypothetical protein n=1 Tax=unclassified Aquipuribacter TaxID=2635084 RepID=UPI003EF07E56